MHSERWEILKHITIKMVRKIKNHPSTLSQNKLNIYFAQMKYYFYYTSNHLKQKSWGMFYTNVALTVTAFTFEM